MTDNFVVTSINGIWIIGNNKTSSTGPNGVKNTDLLGSILYVPSIIDSHKIEEIGCYAFFRCINLIEVVIENGIKQINKCAFSDNTNLERVTIPASVEFLGNSAIHCYNYTLFKENSKLSSIEYTAKGLITVVFMPDSQISYLETQCISRKERVIIYYLGKKTPKYNDNPFYKSFCKSVKIYANYVNKFGDTKTIRSCSLRAKYISSYSTNRYGNLLKTY